MAESESTAIPEANSTQRSDREQFTIGSLKTLLEELSIPVCFNQITGEVDIENLPLNVSGTSRREALITFIQSDYRYRYTGCTRDTIDSYLNIIADENRYNPVLIHIQREIWDGKNRIEDLYKILNLPESDTLSRTLLKKWLIQAVCLLQNENDEPKYKTEGIIVLCGKQGIGKSRFLGKLAMLSEWFGDGLKLRAYDKDTERRAITKFITELGEIETTFSGTDPADLKGFISRSVDRYRLPYGRNDIVSARRTSFCGSCNSVDYLVDQTGNRRFWTIPVERVDHAALDELNVLQLWAEVYAKSQDKGAVYYLTDEEREQLEKRNGTHVVQLPSEAEVRDILAEAKEHPERWKESTVTNFKACYPILNKYSSVQVGKALSKLGIECSRNNSGRTRRLPILSPCAVTEHNP